MLKTEYRFALEITLYLIRWELNGDGNRVRYMKKIKGRDEGGLKDCNFF